MKKSITIAILFLITTVGIAGARINEDSIGVNQRNKPTSVLTSDVADLQQQIDTLTGTIKLQNQLIQEQIAALGKFVQPSTVTVQSQGSVVIPDTKTIARVDALEVRTGVLEKAVTQIQVKVVGLLNQTIDLLKKLLLK
ncbi:MAG: hypothetical protein WAV09_04140 [Minisyncoccia bacterium]